MPLYGRPHVIDDAFQFAGGNSAANRLVDQIAKPGRFFDACSGFIPEVKAKLAIIAGREEILPQPWKQQEPAYARAKKQRNENPAAMHTRRQNQLIAQPEPLEAPLERLLKQNERIARSHDSMLWRASAG